LAHSESGAYDFVGARYVAPAKLLSGTAFMTTDFPIPVRVTRSQALAREWELVLITQGLAPSVWPTIDGFALIVPDNELETARAALAAYERDNPPSVPEPAEQPIDLSWGMVVALLLLAFFFVTTLKEPAVPWLARGSGDAERILAGELWRTVTALTLHADLVHVLSNAVAAAIFLSAVYSIVGVGLGSVLVLLSGAGGNFLNALMHGSSHISVGASTAIFGAVGMLGVLGMSKRRRSGLARRRAWLPIAAALALLAMLGTAGPRVDIFAHLFGFLMGAVLAGVAALIVPKPPAPPIQWLCATAALVAIVYCWFLALG
jgi:rhomboid protease GluP